MTEVPREQLEIVACPRCGAEPGHPCDIRAPRFGPVHLPRADAAWLAALYPPDTEARRETRP